VYLVPGYAADREPTHSHPLPWMMRNRDNPCFFLITALVDFLCASQIMTKMSKRKTASFKACGTAKKLLIC
jgi:hypothetical protein